MSLNYELLKQIDSKKKKLDAFRPLLPEQVKNLKRLCDVDFTYNSTVIEGNTFSLRETRVVLLDGITIGGKTVSEHLEVINHRVAYLDAIEVWQQQNKKTLFQNMLIEAVNESLDIYLETLEKNIIWE